MQTRPLPLTDSTTLPPTLLVVLRALCRDFVPIVVAQAQAVQWFLTEHPLDTELPRHCAHHRVTLGRDTEYQVQVTRAVFPYKQWMLQRVQDAWAATPAQARVAVHDWNFSFVFALAWLCLVPSLGAISLLWYLIQHGAAARVASLFYLVPPVTALEAWLLFGETLLAVQVFGIVLTALGVALINRVTPLAVR